MGLGVTGDHGNQFAGQGFGFARPPLLHKQAGEIENCRRVPGIGCAGRLKTLKRFFGAAHAAQHVAPVHHRVHVAGQDSEGGHIGGGGVIEAILNLQRQSEIVVGVRINCVRGDGGAAGALGIFAAAQLAEQIT